MKLNEISATTEKGPDGTYAAATLSAESKTKIRKLCDDLGVPNKIRKDKMHVTVIYSRKVAPELKADDDLYPMAAKGDELEIFTTFDDKRALVLKIKCPKLVDRHNAIMAEYGTTYDFPAYQPHVTLSYDCGDYDPKTYDGDLPDLEFNGEYVEDLIFDWQNKK